MGELRIGVRAKPGTSRTRVGGSYGPDEQLVVAVTAPAVNGKANDAVVHALADALDVPRRSITVVSGHAARSKVIVVNADDEGLTRIAGEIDRLRNEHT